MSDLRFGLAVAGDPEPYWIEDRVTVGRHLDNDVVVPGEDVRDFHVRIEIGTRGPRLTPIDGATVHVGDVAVEAAFGLMPDDEIVLGQHRVRVVATSAGVSGQWALHEPGVAEGIDIGTHLLVGRSDDCGLRIFEGHISRRHAELSCGSAGVWLRDLGSANGTFLNGEPVHGACRLFHGDEIAFDMERYQLIGDDPDLTPIRPVGDEPDQLDAAAVSTAPEVKPPRRELATMQVDAIATPATVVLPALDRIRGPALVGLVAPVSGEIYPLAFGRYTIGRGDDADIVLAEPSVSTRHAELELKADGAFLVNLLSTNGTRVNGHEIHTRRLVPGDEIHFGRVRMQFVEGTGPERWRLPRWTLALGAGAVLIVLALFVIL